MSRTAPTASLRPMLGVMACAASAAWASTLAVEHLTWSAHIGALPLPLAGALQAAAPFAAAFCLVACALAARRVKPAIRPVLAACMACCVAGACSSLCWGGWEGDAAALEEGLAQGSVVCDLVGDPSSRDYGLLSQAQAAVGSRTVKFRLQWPDGATPPLAGYSVRVRGRLIAASADEGGRWNHQQGFAGMLVASSAEVLGPSPGVRGLIAPFRDACSKRLGSLEPQAAMLLSGVLLGDKTSFSGTELEQDFRTTGLAHLMAVSGTHLAVVTALILWLLGRFRLKRPLHVLALALCLVSYVVLTCVAASALRACVMCLAAASARLAWRRSHVPSALSLAALVLVCAEPPMVFSIGFELSVLAVAGLVLIAPLAQAWLAWLLPRRLEFLCSPVAATLAASMMTLPVTIPTFLQIPLISPLANVLAVPLLTMALGLGIPALLIGALFPFADAALLVPAGTVARLAAALVHALADVPGACVPLSADAWVLALVFAALGFALWLAWPMPPQAPVPAPRRARMAVCALVLCAVPFAVALVCGFGGPLAAVTALDPRSASQPSAVMLDVGQGDSILVRDGAAAVLVDTGEHDSLLLAALARHQVTRLDAVVITHKDADHCAALPALAGVVAVSHVYVHADLVSSELMADVASDARRVTAGRGLEGLRVGSRIEVGRFALRVLAPSSGGQSENGDSLVQLVEYDDDGDGAAELKGLLTGDAEQDATVQACQEAGDVDFLKVAHHGSRKSVSAEELAQLKPELALIGVGADNSYGHPTHDVLDRLAACHAKVMRTDLNGDIACTFSKQGISVSAQKAP